MSDAVAGIARAEVGCGKRNLRQTRNPRENAGFFIFQKYWRNGVALSENESIVQLWQVNDKQTNEGMNDETQQDNSADGNPTRT